MENTFTSFMKDTTNVAETLNGAKMYATTFKPLLDCNFAVSNWRYSYENQICAMIEDAFESDLNMAITWLFFLRDCRGGLGERRSFRIAMRVLANEYPKEFLKVVHYIPEFGRWDDLIDLMFTVSNTECSEACFSIIFDQLNRDTFACANNEPISLLAKWMPSINTSSDATKKRARILAKKMCMFEKDYRKTLSILRKHLDVTECKMSSNRWSDINYESVPAKAAMIYADAFMKHDNDRRISYIQNVMLGDAKANIGGLNPYEVWVKAINNHGNITEELYNTVWDKIVTDGFPDTEAFDGCIPVIDTSGSMTSPVNKSISIRDVAFSLGTYFSQKANGPFKNKCITFSAHPSWIDLNGCKTPYEYDKRLSRGDWGMNTNIEATFDIILSAAFDNKVHAEDMPKSLLIVSDMQFDSCVSGCGTEDSTTRLFDHIADKWHEYGYKLPKLIFWSLDTWHTSNITVPMIDCGDNGVTLISGFSQNAAKVGASEKKDPMDALIEVLNSERYEVIRKALS